MEDKPKKIRIQRTKGRPLSEPFNQIADDLLKTITDGGVNLDQYKDDPEKFLMDFPKIWEDFKKQAKADVKGIQVREFLQVPEQFKYGNTKIENQILNPNTDLTKVIDEGGFNAEIASQTDKMNDLSYTVPAEFSLPEGVILPDNFNYSMSKRLIVNTAGNAYDQADLATQSAGAKTIRADHFINMMNGDSLTTDVRPETVEELIEDIEPLTTVRLEIDATNHQIYNSKDKNRPQLEQNKFTGYLLPVEIIERKEHSKGKQVYLRILTRPALYEYANEAGQLVKVNYQALDLTKKYLEDGTEEKTIIKQMSKQRRAIRDFILSRIYGYSYSKNYTHTQITYSSIYEIIEKDLGKVRKQTLDRNIEKVAQALEQKEIINKYEIIPKGRTKLHRIDLYHKKG